MEGGGESVTFQGPEQNVAIENAVLSEMEINLISIKDENCSLQSHIVNSSLT